MAKVSAHMRHILRWSTREVKRDKKSRQQLRRAVEDLQEMRKRGTIIFNPIEMWITRK